MMNTLQVLCVAVCFLGAFAPALGQDNCNCTKFYIQNINTGDVITYEPADGSFHATEAQGLPQQLWEYKGQLIYNTLNNQVLTAKPFIETTATLRLTDPADTTVNEDSRKWNFNTDNSIQSFDGYTLSLNPDQVIAYNDVTTPNDDEQFKVVLSPL